MYAAVVGQVDTSISDFADIASQEVCDRQQILWVAEVLRQALLNAEEEDE